MKLYIKNMVCDRCIIVVKAELEKLGLQPIQVALGEVDITADMLAPEQLAVLKAQLENLGFELIEDRRSRIVEAIKTTVIDLIHRRNDDTRVKHSEYLAQALQTDYAALSKLFSEEEGLTIEQYIILQKIEKVKELLSYGTLTLSEIAWQMGYSSVAALSAQFKKVTHTTPSMFKSGLRERKTLDKVGK